MGMSAGQFGCVTEDDARIQEARWANLMRMSNGAGFMSVSQDTLFNFLSDYASSGRDWKPDYKYGQARAVVTCQVKGLW